MNNNSKAPPLSTRKKGKQQKNKKNQKKLKNKQPMRPRAHLSECAKLYALALSNPWTCPEPPCIPDDKVVPSFKFSCRAKGSFTVGTGNMGFVLVAPKAFGNDFAGTASPIVKSTSLYAGTVVTGNTGTAGTAAANISRFPYTKSQIGTDIGDLQVRLVGYGLRVFYTGTELNRGGLIQMIRQPQNASLQGMDTDQVYSLQNTKSVPCDRRKHAVCWRPVTPDDFKYSEDPHDVARWTNLANDQGPHCMGALVTGATSGNTFEYEIIAHYETIGVALMSTKSHSDAVGLSAILSSIPTVIETISSVYSGDLFTGAVKAIEAASGLYFGPAASPIYPSLVELVDL